MYSASLSKYLYYRYSSSWDTVSRKFSFLYAVLARSKISWGFYVFMNFLFVLLRSNASIELFILRCEKPNRCFKLPFNIFYLPLLSNTLILTRSFMHLINFLYFSIFNFIWILLFDINDFSNSTKNSNRLYISKKKIDFKMIFGY